MSSNEIVGPVIQPDEILPPACPDCDDTKTCPDGCCGCDTCC